MENKNSDFIYMIIHQLKIPLTRNKWVLDSMVNDTKEGYTSEQKELFQKIYADNDRVISLVDEMLHTEKELDETLQLNKIKTDLPELVEKIIEQVSSDALRKEIILTFTKSNDIPSVLVDPQKIQYVFENLFLNAIHYTPRGEPIFINIKSTDDEVIVSVKDAGIGIPEDEQDKIFSKFFRATNAQKTEHEGNGLGLFIIKNIIEKHAGKVWFESKENVGSTFYTSLPIVKIL